MSFMPSNQEVDLAHSTRHAQVSRDSKSTTRYSVVKCSRTVLTVWRRNQSTRVRQWRCVCVSNRRLWRTSLDTSRRRSSGDHDHHSRQVVSELCSRRLESSWKDSHSTQWWWKCSKHTSSPTQHSAAHTSHSPAILPTSQNSQMFSVHSFSTRLLSSCTDEYAHTYDVSTYWVSSDHES